MCGKGQSSSYGSLPPQSQQVTTADPRAQMMYQQAFGAAQQAAARPFKPYSSDPNAFVAPINPQQQMAIGNINQLAQTGSPYFQAGAGLTQAAGTTAAPQIVGAYMNPYTQAVAAPTLGLLQQEQARQLSQQQAQAIKSGAFGGTRADLERAYLQGQQGLAFGKTAGDIFSAGYQPAMGAAQADLQRQLLAGGQLGQLGAGASQAALAGAGAQLGAGTLQQQTQQAGLQALYNQFLQQQAYPFQTAQFLANVAGGLGPLYGGVTQTAQAQPYFSDPRLKDGIRKEGGGALGEDGPEPIGQTYDGQDIWRYSKFGRPEIGLMAPQVEERYPETVGDYAGYQTIDLPAATDRAAALGRARMGGAVDEPGDYARGGYADGGYADGGAALTTGDLAAILAAHQAMYSGMGGGGGGYGPSGPAVGGGLGLAIPKEGISTGQSIHRPGGVSPLPSKSSQMLGELKELAGASEGFGKLIDLGKAGKEYLYPSMKMVKGGAGGLNVPTFADGGAPEDDEVPKQLAIPTGQIAVGKSIMPESGPSGGGQKKGGGFGDTLGDIASIGSSVATIGSLAAKAAPFLMSFSDPRLKSGIREGMADGGEPDDDIDRYLASLAKIESGSAKDPYSVLGPETKYGRAIGKYQIMPTNVPSWSEAAGLGRLTPEQFRGNKEAQEAVARHQYGQYLKKTGNPEEAAAMWLAGPGYKKHMGARDVLGTSIPEYQARFRRGLGEGEGETVDLKNLPANARSFMATTAPQERGLEAIAAPPAAEEPRGISGFLRGTAPEGAGEKALDFLTSERFLVPALTGLGAMASSPSRYLGSAVLQGLGAGAGSYMDVAGKEAEIAKRQAETGRELQLTKTEKQETRKRAAEVAEKLQDVYGKSIFQKGDMWFVRLANGNTVSLYDWMKSPQPVWGGGAEGAPEVTGAPKAPEATPAAAGAPQKPIGVTPDQMAPPPSWMGWDNKSDLSAKNETQVLMTPGSAEAKKRSEAYRTKVEADAEAAQAQKLQYNDIAEVISDIAHQTGMNTPGAGGTTRAMIVNYGNTIARAAGLGENYFGTSDTSSRLLEKLNTLAAERGVQAGQQTALGALSQLISAQPNIDQPPQAATFNAASNMVNNQMRIDQRDHADIYGQRSGNLYSRAALDFKRTRTPAMYRKEIDALQKTMWEKPDDFKSMAGGGSTPGAIEKYFMDNFNISGMSRYFGG